MQRKLAFTIILIGFTLLAKADSVKPYVGSRIFWDTSTRVTVFSGGGYPRMIQLQDGRLMACCENNGIDIAFSGNKGGTWGSPTKIVSNGNIPLCAPDLVQLDDGTILVAYNPRPTAPYSSERRFGIHLKRSTDNGKTWSEGIKVFDGEPNFGDGCWEPTFLQLPSGELHLYFADETGFTASDEQQISLCRSYDSGLTWTEPQRVSFHGGNGSRDGMPSAVILGNGNIAVAIENSGWPGVGAFVPTIVTSPLAGNWDRWVPYPDDCRWKALDPDYVAASIKGGAPYMRRLPWGETVLSHQSNSLGGNYDMLVYVGDSDAKGFKAMSKPFSAGAQDNYMWNSLCVIDTGVVVAVGNVDGGGVVMQKGYPVRMLQAPYASPRVDGKQERTEGYYGERVRQLMLGRQQGTPFTADFAYDADSLYFTSRVSDTDQVLGKGSLSDGVTLLLDTRNVSADKKIAEGIYRILFLADGRMRVARGNGSSSWQWGTISGDTLNAHYAIAATQRYYIVEAAIPWSALGFAKADVPNGTHMRVNVMLQNRGTADATPVYEMLPDAKRDESWSWMDFYLQPHETTGITEIVSGNQREVSVKVSGQRVSVIGDGVVCTEVSTVAGMSLGKYKPGTFTLPRLGSGIVVLRVSLADGSTVTRKLSLR